MITLENVCKYFETEELRTTALANVNLHLDEHSFVAVTGPSGSGKSTLLNVLGLIDHADSGYYWFNGRDVFSMRPAERMAFRKRHLAFIFQNFNLIDELNVFENVELPLLYQGIAGPERRARVGRVLEQLGIGHRAGHFPQQLSGGQQQRVAIARAIVGKPSLLLADEPTGNLDSKNGTEVMELLQSLHKEGTTILMVTHSPEHAAYADRIVEMRDGLLKAPEMAYSVAV